MLREIALACKLQTKEKENGISESGPQQKLQTCIVKTMNLLNPER